MSNPRRNPVLRVIPHRHCSRLAAAEARAAFADCAAAAKMLHSPCEHTAKHRPPGKNRADKGGENAAEYLLGAYARRSTKNIARLWQSHFTHCLRHRWRSFGGLATFIAMGRLVCHWSRRLLICLRTVECRHVSVLSSGVLQFARHWSSRSPFFTRGYRARGDSFAWSFRPVNAPNHALQRTRPSHHCCNRSVPWAGSLSLGR